MRYLLVIGFSFLALCFQHIIHEYSHVAAAWLFNVKVTHIQWLSYSGGTRVFYGDEPDFSLNNVEKKWALIAGAGFIVTSLLGYLFIGLFVITVNYVKAVLCFFAIIFLIVDSLYFLAGSIFNIGDIVGVRETLKIPKLTSIIISAVIFIFRCVIIKMIVYQTT